MDRILVCTDGSKYAAVCCKYAAWFAKRLNVKIDCLYVSNVEQFELSSMADAGGSFGMQPHYAMMDQVKKMEQKKGTLIGNAAKEIFTEEGLENSYKYHQHTGHLTDFVKDLEDTAQVVFIGKRGENMDIATEKLGSSMESVVRSNSKPCMVTPRSFQEVKKVLVAYDGSTNAERALEFVALGDFCKGMEIHLVVVQDKESNGTAEEYMQQAQAAIEKMGAVVSCSLLKGHVDEEILAYANNHAIDMLAMGAFGHSRIRELILGSTTTNLIRSCHMPLLLFS